MNEVDYIGKKSVAESIRLNKLTKFIIFQQGATRGSTPVYRCTESKSVEKTIRSFEDWADSILRVNQNNNRAYEILLYSEKTKDADIDDDLDEKSGDKKSKTDKVRFSFSLNPYNNMYMGAGMGGGNVEELVKKGIEEYKKDERLNRLERELAELRNGGGEEEDEEEENALDKVTRLITLIRKGDFKQVAGDQEADLDEEEDEEEIPDPDDDKQADKKTPSAVEQRTTRLKIALQRIRKRDPEWKGLYKMSELAKKNPTMFDSYMQTLLKMKI